MFDILPFAQSTSSETSTLDRLDFGMLLSPQMPQIERDFQRLEELRLDIGDELFSSLSEDERQFIVDTEGVVDLGYDVSESDLKKISRFIEDDRG